MALRILEQLKKIFTIKDWRMCTQAAIREKQFVVNPFLTKLHEIEKIEKQNQIQREYTRTPQTNIQEHFPPQRVPSYSSSMQQSSPINTPNSTVSSNNKRPEIQSIHDLLESVRRENIQ